MTRILIAGELNADMVMSGLPSLPIFGRELLGEDFQIVMGSSSAITAARLAQLGAEVDFVGIVGADSLGDFVMEELGNFGVGVANISKAPERTGVTIALTYPQDRALLTFPGTIETYTGDNITSELLANYSHLHVGSFFLQTALQPNLAQIFQQAHALGLTTSLDVGWDPNEKWSENPYLYSILEHVDFFIPNQDEANAIIGANQQAQSLAKRVHGILIIKQGKDGATAFDHSGEIATVSSLPVEIVDTTGAGDAFNAGFIFAHKVDKLPIETAMQFASACGAQAVTHIGGASNAPHADLIRDMIAKSKQTGA